MLMCIHFERWSCSSSLFDRNHTDRDLWELFRCDTLGRMKREERIAVVDVNNPLRCLYFSTNLV